MAVLAGGDADGVASSAIEAIIDVAHGRRPATTVNPDVYDLAPRQTFGLDC